MYQDLAEFIEKNSVSGSRAYFLTAFGIAVATALRYVLNPYLGDAAPYSFQVLVLLLSSSLAGFGPGLFAVAFALVLGWFTMPPYDLPFLQQVMIVSTTAFAGVMICAVTTTMRSALIDAAQATRRAEFLGREMNHRVKNLFAVIASMMTLSARDRPEARAALNELRARVQALSAAHDVAMHQTDVVDLREMMDRLMKPYRKPGSRVSRVHVSGDAEDLPAANVTPLGLILHELATNAVKYGALGTRDGYVRLSWTRQGDSLHIRWQECGARLADRPCEPGEAGFGSLLVEASVAQMRGTLDRNLTDDGLEVRLSISCADPGGIGFRSGRTGDRKAGCNPSSRSSLSVLRALKRVFRRKPEIRDSQS